MPRGVAAAAALLALSACASPGPGGAHPYRLAFFNISDPRVSDAAPELEETLERAARSGGDLVVLTGDVTDGRLSGVSAAARALQASRLPWLAVPGESDAPARAAFVGAFRGHGPDGNLAYWRRDVPGGLVTLVGLDTSAGELDSAQKEWLRRTLASIKRGRRVIVLSHHPLVSFGEGPAEAALLRGSEEARAILEAHKGVALVLSGHVRRRGHVLKNGIHYVSTPSLDAWPCEFTRFLMDGDTLVYQQVPVSSRAAVDRAFAALTDPGSDAVKVFTTSGAAAGYYGSGPTRERLSLAR